MTGNDQSMLSMTTPIQHVTGGTNQLHKTKQSDNYTHKHTHEEWVSNGS